jgi:hypothetical protein
VQKYAIVIASKGHGYYKWLVYIVIYEANVRHVLAIKECVYLFAIKDFAIIVTFNMVLVIAL